MVKILCFSDLHGRYKNIEEWKGKEFNFVLVAGDIYPNTELVIEKLSSLEKPVFVIAGNNDDPQELAAVCDSYDNIYFVDREVYDFEEFQIVGLGGSLTTPFNTRNEYTEEEFENDLEVLKQKINKGKKIIFLVHHPPFGTELGIIRGEDLGSKAIRKFIEEVKPVLTICGHFHENAGKSVRIENCLVINPGPKGLIVTLD